ncbi:uncharacterized protein EV422DRAFT_42391 [Fimicolochytrium jonesii]|uniref:uncharacterized protein n=1 Tax=Fimicolochytrium jonesii TaxID=1396493 RepID=UPI0022FE41C2|nr:uncharacterized protein EV422DRAFT_42391 [Fimicolochytrium jonesii]KAI8821434.1 hypothetical protein EV422DRAFT_42391 [Fimicolochytrium jonesii]
MQRVMSTCVPSTAGLATMVMGGYYYVTIGFPTRTIVALMAKASQEHLVYPAALTGGTLEQRTWVMLRAAAAHAPKRLQMCAAQRRFGTVCSQRALDLSQIDSFTIASPHHSLHPAPPPLSPHPHSHHSHPHRSHPQLPASHSPQRSQRDAEVPEGSGWQNHVRLVRCLV